MLDVDIRSEIANVVGSGIGSDLSSLGSDLPSSLDHDIETISLLNSNTSNNINMSNALANHLNLNSTATNNNNVPCSSSSASSWMGPSWSSSASHDYYVDLGACVNPISVMPLISSSLLHTAQSRTNLNTAAVSAPSHASPTHTKEKNKSHLTFSPAQMKVSAGSIRHEQLVSHIPKQIMSITSTGGTAPATMATNAALQRKLVQNAAAAAAAAAAATVIATTTATTTTTTIGDTVKKDLNRTTLSGNLMSTTPLVSLKEIKRNLMNNNTTNLNISATENSNSILCTPNSNTNLDIINTTTNTIKLAPGIGGLTFANNIAYNKLKQQPPGSKSSTTAVTANGTIVLKRERNASPLQNMTTLNGSKLLARNVNAASYAPRSIASAAHSPHHHMQHMRSASPAQSISMSPSSNSSSSSCSMAASPSTSHNSHMLTSYINNISNNNNNNNNSSNSNSSGYQSVSSVVGVKPLQQKVKILATESDYPRPAYSYSCLIAMALKNSRSGSLPVSEIYSFMCQHFPYFKSAPSGWKNSVRHNLSLNKCFEKIEKPAINSNQRKGCLWAMSPDRIAKMDEEVQKWSRKDPMAIRNAMICPEHLEALERGEMKHGSSADSDVELDSQSEIEEISDLEEQELDDVLIDNCLVEEDLEVDEEEEQEEHDDDAFDNVTDDNHNQHQILESLKQHNLCRITTDQQRDFDIEVEDIYDAIDIEDDKSIIEIGTADLEMNSTVITKSMQQQQQQQLQQQQTVASVGDFQNAKRARLSYTITPIQQNQHNHHQQQQQQQSPQTPLQRQQQINKQQLLQLQQQLKQQQLLQQSTTATTTTTTAAATTTTPTSMKKIKLVQQILTPNSQQQQNQQQQQQNQQNIVLQTIANGTTTTTTTMINAKNNNTNNNNKATVLNNLQFAQLAGLQQQQQHLQHQQSLQQRRKVQLISRIS